MKLNKETITGFIEKEVTSFQQVDWNNLKEAEDFAKLPIFAKLLLALFVVGMISFLANKLVFSKMSDQLQAAQKEETTLMQNIDQHIASSLNLEAYREQYKQMDNDFKSLKEQLPRVVEMDGILDDITKNAISNGLEIVDIQTLEEEEKELYIEVPFDIAVSGRYHDFAKFASDLSKTQRIITLHDFKIEKDKEKGVLLIKVKAKTYRYKDIIKQDGESK